MKAKLLRKLRKPYKISFDGKLYILYYTVVSLITKRKELYHLINPNLEPLLERYHLKVINSERYKREKLVKEAKRKNEAFRYIKKNKILF